MGELVPVFLQDCVPGDKVKISCESLVRFAPMVAPPMGRVNVYTHYFFVPKRLLWDNYANWLTGTLVGGSIPVHPYFELLNSDFGAVGSLRDHLGVPDFTLGAGQLMKFSALPFAAYQLVFNEYYRDQNIYNAGVAVAAKCTDGNNGALWSSMSTLRRRAWNHDRFTSALPFAQKGAQVTMPIQGDVTLKSIAVTTAPGKLRNASAHATISGAVTGDASGDLNVNSTDSVYDPNGTLEIASAQTTISDFRRAMQLQRFLEKKARGGTRLTEFNYAVYGVKGSDARLQRPEYITGAKAPVQISEVLNTTGTTGQLPQGNMSGHGIGVVNGQYGKYFCEEHGYIIGIMSILPTASYQQGFPKHFLKYTDATEEFIPEFENIGEQPIANREVYVDNAVNPDAAFGYTPRYSEYKYANSRVSGQFKTTLNAWTFARIFSGIPSLNESFITCDPSHRNFAVTDPAVHKMYVHHYNRIGCIRPMQKYGNPM